MAKNKLKGAAAPGKPSRQLSLFSNLSANAYYLFDNVPFVFFCALLAIMYIANSHYAVRTIKEVKVLQEELKRISWESNSRKSQLMFESMQANVAQKVHHLGLRELKGEQPKKILLNP